MSLAGLTRLHARFGGGVAARKLAALRALRGARLTSARQVQRLHELLCFLRAYPDDAAVLAEVERQLAAFARRRDLRRVRDGLADTGIAGTDTRFPFFAATASWLARDFGDRLTIDWDEFDQGEALERLLPHLAHFAETPGLDEVALELREWLDRMRGRPAGAAGRRETDAAFVVRGIDRLPLSDALRESLYDGLQLWLSLAPGPATPSRTTAKFVPDRIAASRAAPDRGLPGRRATPPAAPAPAVFQSMPLRRERPRLPEDLRVPPLSVRDATLAEGRRLVRLAREAMVARSRDLDVFAYGDSRDVRLVDWGGGLQFACIGAVPERRLLLESVYGLLTLKNGVPIGYVLISAINASSEIAYNVFETWRGGESAWIYGRVLATARHLFGSDAFTIYPYQLGDDNAEALKSGAWWFYQKLGFRPRDPGVRRLMNRELLRMRRRPGHRSSIATLRKLAAENMFWHAGRPRDDVIGVLPLCDAGLAVTDFLARRFGSDRARAAAICRREAAARLGVRSTARWSRGERLALQRWAPLVLILPGLSRWTAAERRALVAVVRAKGGRRESDFNPLFDRHRRLRRALASLARGRS